MSCAPLAAITSAMPATLWLRRLSSGTMSPGASVGASICSTPAFAGAGASAKTLAVDSDILDHFRNGGPGWQTRINDALRAVLKPGRHTARRAPGTQAAPAVDAA